MSRRQTSRVLRAVARAAALLLLSPLVVFVVIGSVAPEFSVDRYAYVVDEGYVPVPAAPMSQVRSDPLSLTTFYLRFLGGVVSGAPGRCREAADRPLTQLLLRRSLPSLGALAVAMVVAIGAATAGALLGMSRGRSLPWPVARVADLVEGLPLPFVAMVTFVAVVRLTTRGSPLESDAAMILWAGLALALGDAIAVGLLRDARDEAARGMARPHVLAARLRGETARQALVPNLLPVLAARIRGALLLFLGGLVVVEPALGINGLGETFKDIVTDRAGTDALLFAGVLLLFAIPVAGADLIATLAASGSEAKP